MGLTDNRGANRKYIYTGVFFQKEDVLAVADQFGEKRLSNTIDTPHVTFSYKPDEVDTDLFGQRVDAVVIGYGNDGRNEGLRVELRANHAELRKMIEKIPVAHITISVAEGVKPLDTGKIKFNIRAEKNLVLRGVFGAFCPDTKL